MKIKSIETFCVRVPLKPERRMISALGRHDNSEFVLVRLTTDNGIIGAGEATVMPRWSGETVWGTAAIIERLFARALIGEDPADAEAIDDRLDQLAINNWFAKSAIEMACWDVVGKFQQKPVYELFGGAVRPLTIRNRFSLGAYATEIAASRAAALVEAGFQTIKVKVGGEPNTDLERARAVRAAIGPDCEMTVDANGGWNFDQADHFLKHANDLNISWFEQPLPRGDYTETKKLKERYGIKILADESCFDAVQMHELMHHQCCDAVTLYPGKQGGLRKARGLADIAADHGIPCTIGSNLEWDLGAATMMQFVVSTPNIQVETLPGDCLGPTYHEFSIAEQPLVIDAAFTTLASRPGLGIDVNWDLIQKHQIS